MGCPACHGEGYIPPPNNLCKSNGRDFCRNFPLDISRSQEISATDDDLESERDCISIELRYSERNPICRIFDAEHWARRDDEMTKRRLQLTIDRIKAQRWDYIWERQHEVKVSTLIEAEKAMALEHTLVTKQAHKLLEAQIEGQLDHCDNAGSFISPWLTNSKGMGKDCSVSTTQREIECLICLKEGRRRDCACERCRTTRQEDVVQYRFREIMIAAQNAKPLRINDADLLWCPVTRKWQKWNKMTAIPIFAHKHGEELFTAIFGRKTGAKWDIYSPSNGLLVDNEFAKRFESGLIVIVPSLSHAATAAEVKEWHKSPIKSYKLRVLDRESYEMREKVSNREDQTWIDLDKQELEWRSNHRPSVRYLYFVYLRALLRKALAVRGHSYNKDILLDTTGKPFWTTPGPYLERDLLYTFVLEFGPVFEAIVEGAEVEQVMQQKEPEKGTSAVSSVFKWMEGSWWSKTKNEHKVMTGNIEDKMRNEKVDETALAAAAEQIIFNALDLFQEEDDKDVRYHTYDHHDHWRELGWDREFVQKYLDLVTTKSQEQDQQ